MLTDICVNIGSHALDITVWWSRSEGFWTVHPLWARWKVPHDHRPAHSRGLSKPIKPTDQALTLIKYFHKRHHYIILTLQWIILIFILSNNGFNSTKPLSQPILISDQWGFLHFPESNFTVSAQATIVHNEFENYTFKITATPTRCQWVNKSVIG